MPASPAVLGTRVLLRTLLPADVAVSAVGTRRSKGSMSRAEAIQLRDMEREASRLCLRVALRDLGEFARLPNRGARRGAPVLPPGFVASVSHDYGLVVAVAARTKEHATVGIDVQHVHDDAARLLERAVRESQVQPSSGMRACEEATVVLSAKESGYKALYALGCAPRAWTDVEVRIFADGTFKPSSLRAPMLMGRWLLAGNLVIAGVWAGAS